MHTVRMSQCNGESHCVGTALAEKVWDPLSAVQTKRLVSYLTDFQKDFPTITPLSKALQAVCTAVTTRMRRCLDTDIYIPLYSKQ